MQAEVINRSPAVGRNEAWQNRVAAESAPICANQHTSIRPLTMQHVVIDGMDSPRFFSFARPVSTTGGALLDSGSTNFVRMVRPALH